MPSHAKVVKREQWEEGEKGGASGREGAGKERERKRERSWFAMVAVNTLVMKTEGGVEGFRRRVLSGLDACKINILWTLLLD